MKELRGRQRMIGFALLVLACLIIIFPFAYIFINSIKRDIDIYNGALVFNPTLQNFEKLLLNRNSPFLQNLTTSIIVAIVSTFFVLLIATLAGYALARFRWSIWVSGGLLAWLLIFRIVPTITLVGPWYVIFRTVGLYDSVTGLIIAHITVNLPLVTVLMISFIQDLPQEIEDAALIDGCNQMTAFTRVVIPLIAPGLVAAGILAFIHSWNEFAIAVNLTTNATATLPVAIANNAQQWTIRHAEMAAGAVIATVPALVLIFLGQRFIVKGLTMGAVK